MMLVSLGGWLAVASTAHAVQRMDLDLAFEAWEQSAKGGFSQRLDRRGVLTMSHPSTPAAAGEHATTSRLIDLPKGAKGPLVLRFYLTDDYCGDREQAVYFRDAVQERVADSKAEVRFCEVLLDDVVVWSKDVLGRSGTTAGERFYDLDISELVQGKTEVSLGLRVRDEADTGQEAFATEVYWARPELLWDFGATPPPVEFPPRLPFRREKFRPASPPPLSGSTTLTLRNLSGASLDAWPVRWGVPLPQGAVTEATQLALTGPQGKRVPLEAEVTAPWPDGSAKWVLLDFVAPLAEGDADYQLEYGAGVSSAPGGTPAPVPSAVGRVSAVAARGEAETQLTERAYTGLPFTFIRHTLEASGAAGGVALRELAVPVDDFAGPSCTVGLDGAPTQATGGLRQVDHRRVVRGTEEAQEGRWDGWALSGDGRTLVCLRWPWQQAPNGLRLAGAQADLLLLGPGADGEPLSLAPGQAKSHEVLVYRSTEPLGPGQAAALNAVFQRSPVVVYEPGWVAATGALGPFQEQDDRRFPEYEAAVADLARGVLARREQQGAYGWEHFGDLQFEWGFGEALTYWQNTEYDYAHALLWQFLRTGDPELFYLGEQAALHYRDVDVIHASEEHPEWVGGAHHHSETHTGHPPSISHHWTEGLFDHGLLTGDQRSLDGGRMAAQYAARVAESTGYGGGEREAGWNLIALLGAYRATGDQKLLDAARKKVGEVLAYLDPVRGVSSAPIFEQTAYEGGTPFMAAILMRGLTAYYEATRDERVGWAICGLCDWLECEMMPSPGRFAYKQAPELRSGGPQLLAVEGTAFAWNFSGDPAYRRLALDVYRQGVGGVDITNMRDMPHSLALLATALPPVTLAGVDRPLLAPADEVPAASFRLRNLSGQAESVQLRLRTEGHASEAAADVPDAFGETSCTIPFPTRDVRAGVARVTYSVTGRGETLAEGELATVAMPRVPRVTLLAPEGNLTARALDLLQVPYQRAEMPSFDAGLLAQTDVLLGGLDVDRAPLESHAGALAEWVRSGGVVVGFRDNSGHNGWLPSPLQQDASYEPGELLQPDAPALCLLHEITPDVLRAVHGGSMYAAFHDLGDGWVALASTGKQQGWDNTEARSLDAHYGLIELRLGAGRIVLCQLIPEYAWLNDDAGGYDSPGRLLLENLLAHACLSAP